MLIIKKLKYFMLVSLAIVCIMPYAVNAVQASSVAASALSNVFAPRATLSKGDNNIIGLDNTWEWSDGDSLWHTGDAKQKFKSGTTVQVAPVDAWADVTEYISGEHCGGSRVIYNNEVWESTYCTTATPGGAGWMLLSSTPPKAEYTFEFEAKSREEMIAWLESEKQRLLESRKIFAYMPSWGPFPGHEYFDVRNVDWDGITHLTYSFLKPINLNTNSPTLEWDDEWAAFGNSTVGWIPGDSADRDDGNKVAIVPKAWNALSKYDNKYFVFSVGGWTYSEHEEFEQATSTAEKSKAFATNIVNLMVRYGFDGVDIDWEFPLTPEAQMQFLRLHKDIRDLLTEQGIKDEKYYQLSTATTPNPANIKWISPVDLVQYVDTVNYMAYDYNGGSFGPSSPTGHNAPLYESIAGSREEGFWIDYTVNEYLKQGVPANQLMMGFAFYGRNWLNVANEAPIDGLNGLNVTGYAPEPPGIDYQGTYDSEGGLWGNGSNPYYAYEMLLANKSLNYTRYWDPGSMTPYLYSPTTKMFHSYDDPESIQIKVDYTIQNNLAGGIIWDITGDTRPDRGTSGAYTLGNILKPMVDQEVAPSDDARITTSRVPDAYRDQEYSTLSGTQIKATGLDVKFSLKSSSASWIRLDGNSGQLSGKPTAKGSVTFTVEAKGSTGVATQRTYTINVLGSTDDANIITDPSTLPKGYVGEDYGSMANTKIQTTGKNVKLSMVPNSTLSWLKISSDGQLSGVPDKTYDKVSYEIVAVGDTGESVRRMFAMTVLESKDDVYITTQMVARAVKGKDYSTVSGTTKIESEGRVASFRIDEKADFPSWLKIDETTGQLSGIPTELVSNASFAVIVIGTNGSVDKKTFLINVVSNEDDASIRTQSLPMANKGQDYSEVTGTIIEAEGKGITFAIDKGGNDMLAWLVIDEATGQLSGIPSNTVSILKLTVVATASNGTKSSRTFDLGVYGVPDIAKPSSIALPLSMSIVGVVVLATGVTVVVMKKKKSKQARSFGYSRGTAPSARSTVPSRAGASPMGQGTARQPMARQSMGQMQQMGQTTARTQMGQTTARTQMGTTGYQRTSTTRYTPSNDANDPNQPR